MQVVSSTIRIVFGLVCLTISVVLVAGLLGLIPNPVGNEWRRRATFAESAAITFMALAPRMDAEEIEKTLTAIAARQPDVESLGIRQQNGRLVIQMGDHAELWDASLASGLSDRQFSAPISAEGGPWGHLEVRYQPVSVGPWGLPIRTDVALSIFMGIGLSISFWIYLRKVLEYFDPSRVVPPRVREALNALAEGLLLLDRNQRIVLANKAFSTATGMNVDSLLGHHVSEVGFQMTGEVPDSALPWEQTLLDNSSIRGALMRLGGAGEERMFSVSTVPIHDEPGACRGVVASFEDVTELEQKQRELREALRSLRQSSEEIKQQNRELEWLATRDALTGCMNRRSFFKLFEEIWIRVPLEMPDVSVVMVDIDHFKAINDNHGHSKGDEVLKRAATVIMGTVPDADVVCRYGGEEFSILMPNTGIDDAELRAERVRLALMGLRVDGLKITASLGVSSVSLNATSPQDLLDQADKCLYVAKRHGRNQVIRYDEAQEQIGKLSESLASSRRDVARQQPVLSIPFQAVTALVSAMSFRDHHTAAHSRRVADLCVATAEGLLSMRDCYSLEIAALLHDIGKIGVPDNVLNKAEKLTSDEWEVMRRHNSVGVQLVKASFGSDALTEIMEQHSLWYDMSNANERQKSYGKPSLAARILAIADAYDSMTTEAAYRRRLTRAEAIEELRRCAGSQFDSELVERFVSAVRLKSQEYVEIPRISTDTALSIGLQIERLVAALDDHNMEELRELTEKLQHTARRTGIDHMVRVAAELQQALTDETDIIEITQIANDLLDLCRLTQVSLIHGHASVSH